MYRIYRGNSYTQFFIHSTTLFTNVKKYSLLYNIIIIYNKINSVFVKDTNKLKTLLSQNRTQISDRILADISDKYFRIKQ